MAAKLLHSLADDNPDLQKQIGCMTGIFQIFDRHQVLAARRLNHKRLTAGNSHLNNDISKSDSNDVYYPGTPSELNKNTSTSEKQRISTESSRASFSSSCSSSYSSLECHKASQQESSSFDRIIFPETPSRDAAMMNQSSTSPRMGRQSLDLRDVVNDSMYREGRGLSVKTASKEEAVNHIMKHKDSPRPLQVSKSFNESRGNGISCKKNVPADLKESLRVLAKLQEAPWYHNNDGRELPRTPYEANGSWNPISRDAPRFSYDGREINRLSFESRDSLKSMSKMKELPRLSLDSREGAVRGSNYLSKSSQKSDNLNNKSPNLPPSFEAQKRPSNVVAKLMGLEMLPNSIQSCGNQSELIDTCSVEENGLFSRSLRASVSNRPIRTPKSPRSSMKDPASPRWKNADFVMKPISSSRFPLEPAPWRQVDGGRSYQKQTNKAAKVPAKGPNSLPSVYSEIEKRLKDLEFKQSGKDLRALKQILEAMQAKGLLDTRKDEQPLNLATTPADHVAQCTSPSQNMKGQRRPQKNNTITSSTRSSDSFRTFESPIVIMKPAKLVEKDGIPASSVIPIDGLPSLHKIQNGGFPDKRKGITDGRAAKENATKGSCSDSAATAKRATGKKSRATQSLTKPLKESAASSVKSSGSVSPRIQQKKLEWDRRSRPPTPPSDSNKPRRLSNKKLLESSSPSDKRRTTPNKFQQSDDQLSQISNESRNSSYQGDDSSVHSDTNIALESEIDVEVTSILRSINDANGSHSPSMKASMLSISGLMQNKSTPKLGEDHSLTQLAAVAPEHPSPVSVLDDSVYKDDSPSPVKQIMDITEDDGGEDGNDSPLKEKWMSSGDGCLVGNVGSGPASEINRKKLENIEHLVQKLTRLNSNHDEASTDYIASLCENKNPEHRYISEILLASGLLLKDLDSGLTTFQLHPSGHPINPELFFVLEQTKTSSSSKLVSSKVKQQQHSKPEKEKLDRKLIFDAVNEILVRKLGLVGASVEPWVKSRNLARKTTSAQKLLKELCSEVGQLEGKKSELAVVEEDYLKSVLWEDVMQRSESWTEFHGEIAGIALDVERLVFKDLVSEVVIGEAASLRRRKQQQMLFAAAK